MGPVQVWFSNCEAELLSWVAFCLKAREVFESPDGRAQAAKSKLETRSQLGEEPFITYIEDILWLRRKVDPQMVEADSVAHLMKGVSEDTFRVLLTKEPSSVKAFVSECKKLDVAQQDRLEQLRFGRLPNVVLATAQAPCSTTIMDFQ